ncbi:FAD-binding oxidoreductase [Solilutibacter silvestris]|uniref:FAD-binding oxidoreductase n=1 Tax=Solilutibacter silvestris TaxID=1645665 RepID=UPI003D32D525
MDRRKLLKSALFLPLAGLAPSGLARAIDGLTALRSRLRPGSPDWPGATEWSRLDAAVGGRLLRPVSPFSAKAAPTKRAEALAHLKNPYYLGDEPALTQTSGWADAWRSSVSPYAVAATSSRDVAAAVNFARQHRLRLAIKGGGHSYQGTSNAPDSLLIWTRRMNAVTLHDDFVPAGTTVAPQHAVSVGSGALWADAYDAVTTRGGRYVQGGGCMTVGVAGLVQSGGFGSFSKRWGTAAGNVLEAEVVTADGQVRIANAATHPDLFWAIKGGGGGSIGVITRLTLRTFELPETFGAVFGSIRARTPEAYRALVAKALDFYRTALFNPNWGEQMRFAHGETLGISMVFQGISRADAERIWAPFSEWVKSRDDLVVDRRIEAMALPARHFWDAEFFRQHAPGLMVDDDREGAARHHVLWAGDQDQVGWFIHAYQSAWLPSQLLSDARRSELVDAICETSRQWDMALHFNKGLGGADPAAIERARDTATHPQMLDAFALAIIAASGDPAFPGMADPDLAEARHRAKGVERAMNTLRRVAPDAGSYVSESNYFERDWQRSHWGANYPRLARVKAKYDPDGLFTVHHGVGSERWNSDGFDPMR